MSFFKRFSLHYGKLILQCHITFTLFLLATVLRNKAYHCRMGNWWPQGDQWLHKLCYVRKRQHISEHGTCNIQIYPPNWKNKSSTILQAFISCKWLKDKKKHFMYS